MSGQVCHFHADEWVVGVAQGTDGAQAFTCPRANGHPQPGPYTWFEAPTPPEILRSSGVAAEFGLAVELPAALAQHQGRWVEYGVLEHAYATANPIDFAALVERYGHTAIKAKRYTASAFLARTLSDLSRQGTILFRWGPSTGRWTYNTGGTSYWTLAPEPVWSERLSWADTGLPMDYVPGSTE